MAEELAMYTLTTREPPWVCRTTPRTVTRCSEAKRLGFSSSSSTGYRTPSERVNPDEKLMRISRCEDSLWRTQWRALTVCDSLLGGGEVSLTLPSGESISPSNHCVRTQRQRGTRRANRRSRSVVEIRCASFEALQGQDPACSTHASKKSGHIPRDSVERPSLYPPMRSLISCRLRQGTRGLCGCCALANTEPLVRPRCVKTTRLAPCATSAYARFITH